MRRLVFHCAIALLASCSQKPPGDAPMDEVRKIKNALKDDERTSIRIVDAIVVRDGELPPFICGAYETPRLRREGYVKIFIWSRGRLLPNTFHDNTYACMKQHEINASRR